MIRNRCANHNPFLSEGSSCDNFTYQRVCSECEAKENARKVFARLVELSKFTEMIDYQPTRSDV